MNSLSFARLHLRKLTIADSNFVYTLFTNDQVLASYETAPIATKEQTIPFIQHITQPDCFVWLISILPGQQEIGMCALHHWDKTNRSIEIGGTLLPSYWGQGLMTEAFQQLLTFAYTELGIETIQAKTQTTNKQAIRMASKLGFKKLNKNDSETILVYRATSLFN